MAGGPKMVKGCQLWKLRKTHGRKKKFQSPETFWAAAVRYFEWCENNPWKEQQLVTNRGSFTKAYVERPRAMTQAGLCLHIGLSHTAYAEYRARPEFAEVAKAIDLIMYEQKFTGAAAGVFNYAIIARELGLTDKQEVSGPGGGPIQSRAIDKEEYAEIRRQMMEADDC